MKLFIVSIYDKRAANYGAPMAFPTLGVAERSFGESVNDPSNIMARHPEDFSMQHLGEFDTETGVMYAKKEGPEHLMDATQLRHPQSRVDEEAAAAERYTAANQQRR